jgi:hypothetical protein
MLGFYARLGSLAAATSILNSASMLGSAVNKLWINKKIKSKTVVDCVTVVDLRSHFQDYIGLFFLIFFDYA